MRHHPTLDELEEQYFQDHPEEIEPYLSEIFEDYAQDGDSAVLLASLRVIARVKGITKVAEQTKMTRQGLQKALSGKGNPRLDNINSIMHALGFRLTPQKLDASSQRMY